MILNVPELKTYLKLFKGKGYYWREIRVYSPQEFIYDLCEWDTNVYTTKSAGSEEYFLVQHSYHKHPPTVIPLILVCKF